MKPYRYIIILLLILAGALWLWGIHDPFVGIYNANNNYLTLSAKNYFRFGFQTLHFLPTYFASYPLPVDVNYYLHHPILFFLIASVPFMLFGFHNWVAHVATGLFSAGVLYFIYKIGNRLWGKDVGISAMVLAALFPMASFFWKFMFFEQITLFFNLWILYLFLLYREKPKIPFLILISLLSFLCMLSDWYALYLMFLFPLFFLLNKKKETFHVFVVYGISVAFGLAVFFGLIAFGKGNLQDLIGAVSVRSFATELFSLSYPYVRLLGITVLRIGLYFSPLAFVGLYFVASHIKKNFRTEKSIILLSLFVLGMINVVVLPTATWGHSYFLYPFLPFFAFGEALVLVTMMKKPWLFYGCLILVAGTGIAVNYGKIMQVRKQSWKYELAYSVSQKLTPYEPIGVVNFSGDVFEQYFLHPSEPLSLPSMQERLKERDAPRFFLILCADLCTDDELKNMDMIRKTYETTEYRIGEYSAWLVEHKARLPFDGQIMPPDSQDIIPTPKEKSGIRWYRYIRDFLGVGQI